MSKQSKRVSISMPTVAEDRAITAAAKADADAQPLTPKQLKKMMPPVDQIGVGQSNPQNYF